MATYIDKDDDKVYIQRRGIYSYSMKTTEVHNKYQPINQVKLFHLRRKSQLP